MDYNISSVVLASDCDCQTKLSVLGAMRLAQDHSCNFLHSLNVDGIRMKKDFNALWVYTKNKTKFLKPLLWNEKFDLKCFISVKTSVRMVVDTAFFNASGELVVYSRIEMCMIDATTYRVRCIEDNMFNAKVECMPCLCECEFEKLVFDEAPQTIDSVFVRSTSIDYCKHTINVEYVRFLLNTYTIQQLGQHPICSFQINYVNQTLEGDKLQIVKHSVKLADCFEILSQNKCVAKCVFEFENNEK